ncbi:MAG: MBL fold metallo-hydrolase [Candidatus Hydrogenedentes bacterium]|nr:MBL fold metallo-hydrolase [Candidatus Hydrogenedentota bacterium]
MLGFSLLGSGSSGNALLVRSPSAKILIDNGLSFRQIQVRAASLGETVDNLKAVFVTHEHADHVNGVGTLARKLGIPVYLTGGTLRNLPLGIGALPQVREFEAGDEISVDGLILQSFSVSHDAADPVSYVVRLNGASLGVAADLGHASQLVRTRLAGCHALILESNYCPTMIQAGPYPPAVQQRIRGRLGHLSNPDASALLSDLLHDALQIVVLVHISEDNNTPRRAYQYAAKVLEGHQARLFVARKDRPTRMFEIRP